MLNTILSKYAVSAFLALAVFAVSASPSSSQEAFSSEPLTIETSGGKVLKFNAELATTAGQREQGLMFRKSMPQSNGMLFDFGADRDVMMWMKNTFIALDMLFISKEGRITHVHPNAVPHSEDIISSRGPVRYVLELNGGVAKELGIKSGDIVRSARIGNSK